MGVHTNNDLAMECLKAVNPRVALRVCLKTSVVETMHVCVRERGKRVSRLEIAPRGGMQRAGYIVALSCGLFQVYMYVHRRTCMGFGIF